MPVDDDEQAVRLQDRRHGAREALLVRHAMEGICHEYAIRRPRCEGGELVGIALDERAVACGNRRDFRPRQLQHPQIDIDGRDPGGLLRDRGREITLPVAQIDDIQARTGSIPRSASTRAGTDHRALHQSRSGITVAGEESSAITALPRALVGLLGFQRRDQRAAHRATIAVALPDEVCQRSLHLAQPGQPLSHRSQFERAQPFGFATMSAVLEGEQLFNLLQAEAESLGLLDEPQSAGVRFAVTADAARWAARFLEQTATLVVADGFHVDPGLSCQPPDRG